MWLVILVVIQSTTGRPPLQLKLSTRRSRFRPNLRQSPSQLDLLELGFSLAFLGSSGHRIRSDLEPELGGLADVFQGFFAGSRPPNNSPARPERSPNILQPIRVGAALSVS